MLVVVADKADRTREQDTVGDLSRDQVGAALERQLKRSQKASQSTPGALTDLAANADSSSVDDAIKATEVGSDASEEDQLESLRALRELKDRVPLMAQTNIDSAMKRLLDGGKVSDELSRNKNTADSKGSKSSSEKSKVSKLRKPRKPKAAPVAAAINENIRSDAPKSSGDSKHGPDQQFDDGTVLYTAESLSKISFDDLGP